MAENSSTSSKSVAADNFTTVQEGKAIVLFPRSNSVFYNPVQEFNRDLSIAVIKQFIAIKKNQYLESQKKKSTNLDQNGKKLNKDLTLTGTCQPNKFDTESGKNDELSSKKDLPRGAAGNPSDDDDDDDDDEVTVQIATDSGSPTTELSVDESKKNPEKQDEEPYIRILEALSATGLRAIRYALEINGVHQIIANDLSRVAVANINRNIFHNKVEQIVHSSNYDAGLLMYENRYPHSKRFQVIDLDPYGTPAPFLDASLQSIDDGGLICVTCTDMAGLCGNNGEATFANYGVMPLKTKYCHEMALRIVLSSLDSHAGRYKRYIVPVLSIRVDFYIRMFVRVFTSASEVKRSASKKAYVFHCIGCESFHLQPVGKRYEEGNKRKYNPGTGPVVGNVCEECGRQFHIGGPIWIDPIHDMNFVKGLLQSVEKERDCYGTYPRIKSVLTVISEELPDCPFYYVLDKLGGILHCNVPSLLQFRSAAIHAGYEVSSTHAHSNGVKTNAPSSVIWDILRCWAKHISFDKNKLKETTPGFAILSKDPKVEVSFDIIREANPKSRQMGITRYPENPKPEWGPKMRAKQSNAGESESERRKRLQGKKMKRKPPTFDYKNFPCKRFKQGTCTFGDDCKYSHVLEKAQEDKNIKAENYGKDSEKPRCETENPVNEVSEPCNNECDVEMVDITG